MSRAARNDDEQRHERQNQISDTITVHFDRKSAFDERSRSIVSRATFELLVCINWIGFWTIFARASDSNTSYAIWSPVERVRELFYT